MRPIIQHQNRASRSQRTLVACAALTLFGGAACDGTGAGGDPAEQIDVSPVSLDQAEAALGRANDMLAARPQDGQLQTDARLLRESMDRLSGMVARIDVASDHAVTFYKHTDGTITMGERLPQGKPSVLRPMDPARMSFVEVYRQLAPGLQVPQALLDSSAATSDALIPDATETVGQVGGGSPAPALGAQPAADGVSVTQSALTQADGPFFRNNFCPLTGVLPFCLPDWWNGAFATAYSTHSQIWIAPFAGGGAISLQIRYNGSLVATLAVFMGELHYYWRRGPHVSVTNSGCCFICACGTHTEVGKATHRWDVTNATNKGFHFGGNFYNKPLALNTP